MTSLKLMLGKDCLGSYDYFMFVLRTSCSVAVKKLVLLVAGIIRLPYDEARQCFFRVTSNNRRRVNSSGLTVGLFIQVITAGICLRRD